MRHNQLHVRAGSPWLIGWVLFLLIVAGFPPAVRAQKVYSPEDPVVEEMVEQAVTALGSVTPVSLGESTLGALAIVEARKRYHQEIPRNDRHVNSTIDRILATFRSDDGQTRGRADENILEHNECYYPALALILLAEFDDVKYADQIKQLIKMFEARQEPNGAFTYLNQKGTGDTSQTQYAALALFIAKHHNFQVDPEVAKRALMWLIASQPPNGAWVYKLKSQAQTIRASRSGDRNFQHFRFMRRVWGPATCWQTCCS